jgi:hypothetical protein
MAKRRVSTKKYVLNCVPSRDVETDWGYEDAIEAGVVKKTRPPAEKDLRVGYAKCWPVRDQKSTGACVGFATADGVLHWHYLAAKWIRCSDSPSPRFIWMANKETDQITSYPTTFIERAGTQTKLALGVARKYGCVMEKDLPMAGGLSLLTSAAFYTKAARFRIASYHNLGRDLSVWRSWIANQGPILTRLGVDRTWDRATLTNGVLEQYMPNTVRGGHAVCLVGYTQDHFIVRNSWGDNWGDGGFAYALDAYAQEAFTEAYGAVL